MSVRRSNTPLPPRVLLHPAPTAAASGAYVKVTEGPGAVRVDRYYGAVLTHQLQLDLTTPTSIDFATIKPLGFRLKWYSGAVAVHEYLEADAGERRIFKDLAYELLNKGAGPKSARNALTEFTEGLSDCGCGIGQAASTGAMVPPESLFSDRGSLESFVEPLKINPPFLIANGVENEAVADLELLRIREAFDVLMAGGGYVSAGSLSGKNPLTGVLINMETPMAQWLGDAVINRLTIPESLAVDSRKMWTSTTYTDEALQLVRLVANAKEGAALPDLAKGLGVKDSQGVVVSEWPSRTFPMGRGQEASRTKALMKEWGSKGLVARLLLRTTTRVVGRDYTDFEKADRLQFLDQPDVVRNKRDEYVLNGQSVVMEMLFAVVAARIGAYAPIISCGSNPSLSGFYILQCDLQTSLNRALSPAWCQRIVDAKPEGADPDVTAVDVEIALLSRAVRCFRLMSRVRLLTSCISPAYSMTAGAWWDTGDQGAAASIATEVYTTRLTPQLTQFVDLPEDYCEWYMLSNLFIGMCGAERVEDVTMPSSDFTSASGFEHLVKIVGLSYDHRKDKTIEMSYLEKALQSFWANEKFNFDIPLPKTNYQEMETQTMPLKEEPVLRPVLKDASLQVAIGPEIAAQNALTPKELAGENQTPQTPPRPSLGSIGAMLQQGAAKLKPVDTTTKPAAPTTLLDEIKAKGNAKKSLAATDLKARNSARAKDEKLANVVRTLDNEVKQEEPILKKLAEAEAKLFDLNAKIPVLRAEINALPLASEGRKELELQMRILVETNIRTAHQELVDLQKRVTAWRNKQEEVDKAISYREFEALEHKEQAKKDASAREIQQTTKSALSRHRQSIEGGVNERMLAAAQRLGGNSSDESDGEFDMSLGGGARNVSFRPPSRRSVSTGVAVDDGENISRESAIFALDMHRAIMQVARQFVQRWVDKDADNNTLTRVVMLAVGDNSRLSNMRSANDLLARMVERVMEKGPAR